MANNEENGQSEWPNLTEQHWYAAALSLVIVGVVLGFGSIVWALSGDGLPKMKEQMDLLTTPVTLYLAMVGFCTVAWRGMVTSRQADQQKRQNDAKDEENLAKLLVDGTKLVSDDDAKSAQVHAGIAALQVVATAPLDRFAVHAMDILILVVERTYKDKNQEFLFSAAKDALSGAARIGRFSTRTLALYSDDKEDILWSAINGPHQVRYVGGSFREHEYAEILEKNRVTFSKVYFDNCRISSAATYFKGCVFTDCKFDRITFGMSIRCTLDTCDLSGTVIAIGSAVSQGRQDFLQQLKDSKCFYIAGNPPIGLTEDEVAEFLEALQAT